MNPLLLSIHHHHRSAIAPALSSNIKISPPLPHSSLLLAQPGVGISVIGLFFSLSSTSPPIGFPERSVLISLQCVASRPNDIWHDFTNKSAFLFSSFSSSSSSSSSDLFSSPANFYYSFAKKKCKKERKSCAERWYLILFLRFYWFTTPADPGRGDRWRRRGKLTSHFATIATVRSAGVAGRNSKATLKGKKSWLI